MFNTKNKTDMQQEKTNGGGATLIGAGTTLKGDISSNSDLRIDGTVLGNIHSAAKIIIGSSGIVEGDITCNQSDIVGKVSGNVRAKELLQLRGECVVTGNLYAGKLQVEPSATFNGQCHMGANIVEMSNNEQQAAIK
ncbi:MAG: polymer-forming cytoskeletal protein [Chitinophagaceae bacterium]|jgi:cytoskeletal protein CcmA (bactofilin family)|nr:polymer-forming cytoskeletal protein [Chitinophagaceae bacterium]NLH78463.1 polymer-forming cytoskeletal protein [Acidobacteriota bacterium]MBK7680360.1 polymer-forming cytoskeletal protein [Chitinophagaceae bacterium]MBK8301791.1 polymer-forming cytoskeletal protein [Chitinophagaceae bacterium]MBK9466349.1 polymer-forming cytoskeletal protein [Chitinophagaceae bacterium]